MACAVPPMIGAEYLTTAVLADLWHRMDAAFDAELAAAKLSVQEFLKGRHPAWNLVGPRPLQSRREPEGRGRAVRVPGDLHDAAFGCRRKAQHLPLGKALAGVFRSKNRERLLSLLMPVQRAAEQCPWLKAMVDAGEIYHPLRWSPAAGAGIS